MTDPAATPGYPDVLEIVPLAKPVEATVRVPGSKSITNRALVLAALSRATCRLRGALRSEDTEVMVQCLRDLGFAVETDWLNATVIVHGTPGDALIPADRADLFVANSGTTMRFLTALVALGHGRYRLDGVPRMRERPLEDLLVALCQLGVKASSEYHNGCPPVVIETSGLAGGMVRIKGAISSQFLSGLLMAAPFAQGPITVEVEGPLVSVPYVAMTIALMRQWGLRVEENPPRYTIPHRQQTVLTEYDIEPDASAASYFLGAAAVARGRITALGLTRDSLQGDVRFADVLAQMGCDVAWTKQGLTVQSARLRGVDVDMNAISDCVMTLAAVACFAEGPTTIRNVAHIRHKETDRLHALTVELRKLGAAVEEFADGLRITPGPLRGATMDTYNDHRMAMSLALVGLRVPGVVLRNPGCVAKTYPGFFHDLERLR